MFFDQQPTTTDMEVDLIKSASEQDAIKINGQPDEQVNQSSKTVDKKPGASEMTSADYYFDSYAHFGKLNLAYCDTLARK